MYLAFDTININGLVQNLKAFLDKVECRMTRLLLINTTTNVRFRDISGDNLKTNVGSPQGDLTSVIIFNINLENSLRSLKEEINKRKRDIEPDLTWNTIISERINIH